MVIKPGSVFAAPESVTYYKAGYGEALHLQVVRKWKGFCVKTDSLPTISLLGELGTLFEMVNIIRNN